MCCACFVCASVESVECRGGDPTSIFSHNRCWILYIPWCSYVLDYQCAQSTLYQPTFTLSRSLICCCYVCRIPRQSGGLDRFNRLTGHPDPKTCQFLFWNAYLSHVTAGVPKPIVNQIFPRPVPISSPGRERLPFLYHTVCKVFRAVTQRQCSMCAPLSFALR